MEENWKVVRNRSCIRALMIFIGVILMQMLAYMICVIAFSIWVMVFQAGNAGAVKQLAQANTQTSYFMMWVSLVSAALCAIWCGILYQRSDWRERPFDYKKAFSAKNILMIFGNGAGGCIVLTMVLTWLSVLIPAAFTSYNNVMEHLTDSSGVITLLYVLLIGPVSEELIFRGAILDRFYLAFPFWIANMVQAVLFGLYHMNLIQGLYAFCLGIVLGMIRHTTGSILASILTHIIFNTTSYLLGYLFPANEKIYMWLMLLVTVGGFAICIGSIRYLIAKYKDKEKK